MDLVDLPVTMFINHSFDRAASLLEVFSDPLARKKGLIRMKMELEQFTSTNETRSMSADMLYDSNSTVQNAESLFFWNRATALSRFNETCHTRMYLAWFLTEDRQKLSDASGKGEIVAPVFNEDDMMESGLYLKEMLKKNDLEARMADLSYLLNALREKAREKANPDDSVNLQHRTEHVRRESSHLRRVIMA
eukprot:NODE_7007_length_1617_cov_11.689933.p2 GENE.NODE_7007_length_1617_cov_11.689933~~NODE_7007_length_1617_cov_11.689933.p2  ORF type:complete len:192 (+),score=52.08 NODE_7007_length_1617_cov_11.689933:660-1235(+)